MFNTVAGILRIVFDVNEEWKNRQNKKVAQPKEKPKIWKHDGRMNQA